MAQLTHAFPEVRNHSTQTHRLTIPKLVQVRSVTVDKGNVSFSVNGDEITFNLSGRPYDRVVQTGGSYTPSQSKTETDARYGTSNTSSTPPSFPSSIPYSQGGYSGTLYKSGGVVTREPLPGAWHFTQNYSGTVTKPAVDTRTYDYFYAYTATVDYLANSLPTINIKKPSDNLVLAEGNSMAIEGTASDTD
ncbi:hypothetical protein ABE137_22080, partial [Brevibacillus laterosporus]